MEKEIIEEIGEWQDQLREFSAISPRSTLIPCSSEIKKDNRGTEHLIMHFNVEGPLNKGVVSLHMVKRPEVDSEFIYKYLALDIKGHQRIYLENADASGNGPAKKTKLFGVNWN
jgi:import inner membrane translocase subunit TIM21